MKTLMHYLILCGVVAVIVALFFVSVHAINIYNDYQTPKSYVENVHVTVEYIWIVPFREDCMYRLSLHGFNDVNGQKAIRNVIVSTDCDRFNKGDTFYLVEK